MKKIISILTTVAALTVTGQVLGFEVDKPTVTESDTTTVRILGTGEDSRFEPESVQVKPGDVVRFEVVEGMHTVTAYHPENRRKLRIPAGADSFDSGALTPGDTWLLNITHQGEYNYFCRPHERMGHVGKIVSVYPSDANTK